MPLARSPIATGALISVHQQAGAAIETVNGWQVAVSFPGEPGPGENAVVDLSHWPTFEINGPGAGAALASAFGTDVPLRTIHAANGCQIYRLTDQRAILFDTTGIAQAPPPALDVTGGWSTLSVIGPDAPHVLGKVTAVDLRRETLPPMACCQGPLFGVNAVFGRFENRFELHLCTDSAEFVLEVILDAGREFGLKPAGLQFYSRVAGPEL